MRDSTLHLLPMGRSFIRSSEEPPDCSLCSWCLCCFWEPPQPFRSWCLRYKEGTCARSLVVLRGTTRRYTSSGTRADRRGSSSLALPLRTLRNRSHILPGWKGPTSYDKTFPWSTQSICWPFPIFALVFLELLQPNSASFFLPLAHPHSVDPSIIPTPFTSFWCKYEWLRLYRYRQKKSLE